MKIVIDIDDNLYTRLFDNGEEYVADMRRACVAIRKGTPLPKDNKCKWIHYDYRTVCPEEHDIDNPYWRIPENRMEVLRYCPYCGKEIEIEADAEE